jgi:hypothetical protein
MDEKMIRRNDGMTQPTKIPEHGIPPDRTWDPGMGEAVVALGALTAVAGLITWFSAYAGVDDHRQILYGMMITGFGVTWCVLGLIQREAMRRRPPPGPA